MSNRSQRCVKAAFFFLALGIALGASFGVQRTLGAQLRPLHAELNLWGWLTLLIYGFAYHMLPRFLGQPLPSERLAEAQTWLAIGGVALTSCGWLALYAGLDGGRFLTVTGGLAQLASVLLFAWLMGSLLREF